ncbi:YagK/YfjJ domain-containing protein [Vreelandella andesensis]|nr:inovirus-type Gp2 protein [Halomonas andesensis]
MQTITAHSDDLPTHDDVRAILDDWEYDSDEIATDAYGTVREQKKETLPWLSDLVGAEKDLEWLLQPSCSIDALMPCPVVEQPGCATLHHSPLITTLLSIYTVLVGWFEDRALKHHFRPSAYAECFLWAFKDCDYLHEIMTEGLQPLTMTELPFLLRDLKQRLATFHQATQSSACRERRRYLARKRDHNRRAANQLMEGLFERNAKLLVIRVDLGYTEYAAPYMDASMARQHRQRLCKAFQQHPLFTRLLGYIWKLEYGEYKGFHYHLLLFFNGAEVRQDIRYAQRIGEYWNITVTKGDGVYFNCNYLAEERYHDNAMGLVTYHDAKKRKGLTHIVNYLTKIDEYATLTVRGDNLGHSQSPKPHRGLDAKRLGRPRRHASPA